MMKQWVAVLGALILTGCSSLEFYAPEVGAGWTTVPVVSSMGQTSVDGVSIRATGEEYSPVVSVGTVVLPAYQGARKANWDVVGPGGFQATISLIQTDLVFAGPVDKNVLAADSIDFTKGRQVVQVKVGNDTFASEPTAITASDFSVRGLSVKPTYQGSSGGKVSDYKGWGLTTGLRLTNGSTLVGYLSLTNGTALQKAPQAAADPLLVALALVAAQHPFEGKTPPQKLVPEVVEVFGLKFTKQISHN